MNRSHSFKKFHPKQISLFFSLAIILLFCLNIPFAHAAPKSDLWPFWNQSNEADQRTISHQTWQSLLDQYLKVKGQDHLFDYANVSAKDKARLNRYIQQLTQLDPRTFNQAQQLSYWVNLYNALTVQLILKNYPVSSITKLGGFFSFGPWDQKITTIAGQSLSLNDIEHRILRPIWQDPRIHFVVNCASLGCPNLPLKALTANNSAQIFNEAAIAYLNQAKGVDIKGKTLVLSKIFDWYRDDFGRDQQAMLNYIQSYRPQDQINQWRGQITYEYDWGLNKFE